MEDFSLFLSVLLLRKDTLWMESTISLLMFLCNSLVLVI